MPRTLRIEYPGTIYHVMNRGYRREPAVGERAMNCTNAKKGATASEGEKKATLVHSLQNNQSKPRAHRGRSNVTQPSL